MVAWGIGVDLIDDNKLEECHAPADFAPHLLLGENAAQAADIQVWTVRRTAGDGLDLGIIESIHESRWLLSIATRWPWSFGTRARPRNAPS